MPFAQLVIGPPGAGKSTYCNGMQQFMGAIGRKCSIVNLDPANDRTSYSAAVDVRDLVTLESIMDDDDTRLGPNGGVLFALEELEENYVWLEDRLAALGDDYVLFDCPGQVELFTHHASLRRVVGRLEKTGFRVCLAFFWFSSGSLEGGICFGVGGAAYYATDYANTLVVSITQLVVVNLIDSYALTLPSLYISTLLLSLRSMLQMDLTHINVLTKIDNLHKYPPLPFNLAYYTEVQDLEYLLPSLEQESAMFGQGKFQALNEAIVNLVEEFGLVGFETLAVEDKKSMMSLLRTIDRAGGYAFGAAEGAGDGVWQVAVREGLGTLDIRDVQERWIDNKDEWDEKERREWEEEQKRRENEFNANAATQDFDPDNMDLDNFRPDIPMDSGVKVVRSGKKKGPSTEPS
ncbi:uncharacterized protein A1O9_08275 [Exophiala aquamarina CBS 119918]|uniref:GPN-loop GTPase 2 n=1 Tax=Exophiala aquamarina CBS 119918 TaxID=1182545 RepID=A0A072PJ10_9EURO|nr:uncharacterized protein A1O9_08275 [Exophiala aquamarina CBS 119918]KEF55525.1 hypothetical protein A1O9_08275 [Exophiala aquamarina CBS 119918]